MDTSYIQSLASSELHYAACRAAFLTTLDCLLIDCLQGAGEETDEVRGSCGFLDRIPLLAATAPQIQMQCLFQAWQRLTQPKQLFPVPMDQCVHHAALELLAQLSLQDNRRLLALIWRGPRHLNSLPDAWLYSKIRCLQATQPAWMISGLSSQLDSVRGMNGLTDQEMEDILQAVGSWRIRRESLNGLDGLLTSGEQGVLKEFFDDHPTLFEQ